MNRSISALTLSRRDGVIIVSGQEINIQDDWSNHSSHALPSESAAKASRRLRNFAKK